MYRLIILLNLFVISQAKDLNYNNDNACTNKVIEMCNRMPGNGKRDLPIFPNFLISVGII